MNNLWQDIRFGVRMLWKSPGFTLVAIVALALGIGANTAIFSVVNAVLLRSLPFPAPAQLVSVNAVNVRNGNEEVSGASPADFLDWKAQSSSFAGLAAYSGGGTNLSGGDAPEQFAGARVSDDFFNVFGVKPFLGRTILPEENLLRGNRVIVLSYRLWQRRFGGDPNIVGKQLALNGKSTTVVGVMPPDFKQPAYAEVWLPLFMDSGELKSRDSRYFTVTARLKPGVSRQQAEAELAVIASRLEAQNPETNKGWSVRLMSLHEEGITQVRRALLILLGAVGFVLLIACANVANLLLARATARHKEVAIRTALGATRGRLVRQLLVESVLLALVGGGAGLLLALWGVDAITGLMPQDWRFPRIEESRIDAAVLAFTFGISLVTGLLFGLLPALKASRLNVYEALKEEGRSATAGLRMQRLRGLLVVSEIALTLLLLVGAGLLIKSLLRLQHVDPGFNAQNVLTLHVAPPLTRKYMQDDARATLYRQIVEQVAALPGVASVATNSGPPLASFGLSFSFAVAGRAADTSEKQDAFYSAISPGYFNTLGIPLVAGRAFNEHDNKDAPPVAIINETMARRLFPNAADAVGQRLKIKHYMDETVAHEIVGVVRDAKQMTLSDPVGTEMFVPDQQYPWLSTVLVVHTQSEPASLLPAIKRAVSLVDKDQPVTEVKTMEQLFAASIAQPRFYTLLLGLFAAVALLLAGVGIYGVMAYTVTQRTHEIGVRMALGAQTGDVLKLIVGRGMLLALAGVGLGLCAAFAATRVLTSLLYGVSATDPVTFTLIPLLLVGVALLACYIPARRATKVDPMVALRYE